MKGYQFVQNNNLAERHGAPQLCLEVLCPPLSKMQKKRVENCCDLGSFSLCSSWVITVICLLIGKGTLDHVLFVKMFLLFSALIAAMLSLRTSKRPLRGRAIY